MELLNKTSTLCDVEACNASTLNCFAFHRHHDGGHRSCIKIVDLVGGCVKTEAACRGAIHSDRAVEC